MIKKLILGTVMATALASTASAATIISAVSATASDSVTAVENSIDQSGLSAGYTSGVTDFDAYIASNPMHSFIANTEWFTRTGIAAATVVYDLGSSMAINALALWNEESSGFGSADLLTSNDGVNFTALATINPVPSVSVVNYPAQVFGFADTAFRYFRMDLTGCPNGAGTYNGCAIGEVAFRSGTISEVPVPAAGFLLVGALGGLAAARRRRNKAA